MTNALFVASRRDRPNGGQWAPVGRLEHSADGYRFQYLRGATQPGLFHPFPEMPHLDRVYESDELFPLFSNRLLAKSRPEYEAYLVWGGFDPAHPPAPIAVLAMTEGHRATDDLELFPSPQPDADGCFVAKFFLHGMRYVPDSALDRVSRLTIGESLGVMLDVSNRHDRYAVAVRTCDDHDRSLIGYVPRYLARDIRELCLECEPEFLSLAVERVNPNAPLQQRVVCRLRCCWPETFQPCAGPDFEPVVADEPVAVR